MTVITDVTLRKLLRRKRVEIAPLHPGGITPVGYDVFASDVMMIREAGETRLVDPVDGAVLVPPGAQFLALTREQIGLSSSIAATIHSQVKLVSLGMSHISTTIDPGWYGRLLLAMTNVTRAPIRVAAEEPIATIVFHTTTTPAKGKHGRPRHRTDLMEHLLGRERSKLMMLDQSVAAKAEERLRDAQDVESRSALTDFILARTWRETAALAGRAIFCLALLGAGAVVALGGEPVFNVVAWMYPSLEYKDVLGHQIGLGLAAMGAAWVVWTRRPLT